MRLLFTLIGYLIGRAVAAQRETHAEKMETLRHQNRMREIRERKKP